MVVGYTTGVFDMFHVGHLNIIKAAKSQCDYLIVGVSSDDLVYGYKNKSPVIPFEDRAEIVASIKYVDKVVPQTHRNKEAQYDELKFNIMFVGDDWKGSTLFARTEEYLKARGASVVYFPYTQNVSSSHFRDVLIAIDESTREQFNTP
jgi:glycerol-3-phosphate cytidylyltransferase